MDIKLCKMTKALCRQYMQQFTLDPALFSDPIKYKPYIYNEAECDAYFERHQNLGRVHLAIMGNDEPIGELVLKNIDHAQKCCTMGISMKNDAFKNKGYGTQAEIMAIEYAFDELGMESVYADALLQNLRSQHVLKKAGFKETHQDGTFRYYRCDKDTWKCFRL